MKRKPTITCLSWSPYDNETGGLPRHRNRRFQRYQVLYHNPCQVGAEDPREQYRYGTGPVQSANGRHYAVESGGFASQKETAMIYAFMVDQVGGWWIRNSYSLIRDSLIVAVPSLPSRIPIPRIPI